MLKRLGIFITAFALLWQTAAFASGDITYITADFTEQTGDAASLFGWGYIGSAQTVKHGFENDDTDSFLALSSDGLKNGSPGGSYYLYNTFYPITGGGRMKFKIRFNEGKIKLTAGDQIVSSTLSHEGFSLVFDAGSGALTCCGETLDGQFETGSWYDVDISFDCGSHMLSVETCFGEKEIAFTEDRLLYISNITISNADKLPFSFDIKELELVNENSVNSGGGYMSIDSNNVMHADYPDSAEYTGSLIENMSASPRRMEYLDRGLTAIMREEDVYLSWRWLGTEEIVLPSADGKYLKIYSTTCPTPYKLYTLMHDPIYRAAAAWQNNSYNQPPHLGFAWGYETERIPIPQIYTEHDGVRAYSPYSSDKREYYINTYKGTCYSSKEHRTVISDGYPRADITAPSGAEVSEETAAVMDGMAGWFDEVLGYKESIKYISLPSTAAEISGTVRFVCGGDVEVTDISGTPVSELKNGITYNSDTKTLYIPETAGCRIVVSGEFGKQTFTARGQEYSSKAPYLYDTLDAEPLGSGSDFLDSRMNKNGWQLDGDRENTEVITYADRSNAEKKRLVLIRNNSQADSVFYLDKSDMYIKGIAAAEFDIQLRSEAGAEFRLSRNGNTSLLIKQEGGAIYAADGSEFVLLADGLSLTSGDEAIYRIYADMNFARGIYDIYIAEEGNIKAGLRGLHFASDKADGIDCVSLLCGAGSEAGIDDIDIHVYSGVYISSDDNEPRFADEPGLGSVSVIEAVKNESGELMSLSIKDSAALSADGSDGGIEYYIWKSVESMTPLY